MIIVSAYSPFHSHHTAEALYKNKRLTLYLSSKNLSQLIPHKYFFRFYGVFSFLGKLSSKLAIALGLRIFLKIRRKIDNFGKYCFNKYSITQLNRNIRLTMLSMLDRRFVFSTANKITLLYWIGASLIHCTC